MMKHILKIISFFLLAFIFTPFSSAYKASEHIEINFKTTETWNSIYTIPDWKDLVIYKFYSKNNNANLKFRDNGGDIKVDWDFLYNIYDLNITFEDNIEVKWVPKEKDFSIFWYLVDENEDIEYLLQWNADAWNKHIFNKEDIDFIYFREFIIMFFAVVFKFFSVVTNRKVDIF